MKLASHAPLALIEDIGFSVDASEAFFKVAVNEEAVFRDMDRLILEQPDVPVYARAFIKPPFGLAGIDSDSKEVHAAILNIVRYVVAELRVSALVATKIMTVQPDGRVTKDAIELYGNPPVCI